MLCTSKDITVANVCITDFGLAKFGKDCLATPCGSVSYVGVYSVAIISSCNSLMIVYPKAPEIVANELYDNSVDIWAFGCVLYFMYVFLLCPFCLVESVMAYLLFFIRLFGKPPFYVEGDDEEEIMDLVEEGIYNFPSEVDVSETGECQLQYSTLQRYTKLTFSFLVS